MRYADKSIYDDESILLPRKGSLSNIQYVNKPSWTVDTLYYSIVNKKLSNPFYLYNYLKILDLRGLNSGTGVPSMTFDAYYDLEINLPDLLSQQKIATVLSSLDSKIELNNRINAELEDMAKTLYDYWFVQFDFPFEFPKAGTPSEVEVKPYKSSGGKMVWNDDLKRVIPEGWKTGDLSDIANITGGSTPSKEITDYFESNGTAWITPKDLSMNSVNKFITKSEIDVSEKGLKSASLNIMPKGTVLLSSRAPIGYMAISRDIVTTNQGFKSFVPKQGFTTSYIYYTVKNSIPTIVNNASGSTFKEVSGSVLKTIKTCLPQPEIIEKYSKTTDAIFEKQNIIELENQQLSSLRDWLLSMLMNGQVKVADTEEEKLSSSTERPLSEVEVSRSMSAEPVGEYK